MWSVKNFVVLPKSISLEDIFLHKNIMSNTDLGSVHGRQRGAPKSCKIFEYLNVMRDVKVEEDV